MKRCKVLLIEANDDDVFQFRCAVKSVTHSVELHAAGNVMEARKYLEGWSKSVREGNSGGPDLIVANLPLGPESVGFLEWLQGHATFKDVPVVLWSDQKDAAFVHSVMAAGAERFVPKTIAFVQLCSDIDRMLRHMETGVAARNA